MKNHVDHICLVAILLLLTVVPAFPARGQMSLRDMELGVNGGGMNYIGDLNDQSMLGKPNLAVGAFFRLKFGDRWALAIGGSYGHLESDDCMAWRNLSFRTHLAETYMRMEFNFFPYGIFDIGYSWTPYIFGGIGVFAFKPQALWTNPNTGETDWYELQPLGTEGQGLSAYPDRPYYSLMQVSMPFGLGVKLMPGKNVTLAMEYGFRKTWTDYIDDVSTTYVDPQLLYDAHGEAAAGLADRSAEAGGGVPNAPGIKRGDDSLDDWYAYFNISVSVSFEVLFGWMRGKHCD